MKEDKSFTSIYIRIALFLLLSGVVVVLTGSYVESGVKYERVFFPHWSDLDHNGLNTKQEFLLKTGYTLASGSRLWICPYTGYASSNPREFQLDHVVSLSKAWECGAFAWSPEKRERFANDPDNLLLVHGKANNSKGSKGPESWLPLNLAFADDFIKKTYQIYSKYDMICTDPDPDGISGKLERLLGISPDQLNLDRR